MRFATYSLESGASLTSSYRIAEPGTSWVQFGDLLFVIIPDAQWEAHLRRVVETGVTWNAIPPEAELDELFLVRQKGRLFQQEHPDISVLLDRGRYLIAQISQEVARGLAKKKEPSYTVLPLQLNSVVFEEQLRPAVRTAPDPWVKQFVDRLAKDRFLTTLQHLTSYHTRHSLSTDYPSVTQWCLSHLQAMNYHTDSEQISIGVESSRNIIADKIGSADQERRQIVLVTAHLDSINWTAQGAPEAVAPGADDNGTGSAGLLEIARSLKDHTFTHDLRFVLFGGEEEGLHGSRQYVDGLSQIERSRIRAVVNMDMIGGLNTQSPSVTLESSIRFSQMVNQLVEAGHTYTSLKIESSWHYFDSDHVPFIDANIPAVLTIEGADTSNHYVHSPDDILAHVSDTLAFEILRMNTAFIAMYAK